MRVIAGLHRGRRLRAPEGTDTRPVTDRVKESVFNSIAFEIPDAAVLDLFAGAGSFGIESMSRGAASAVFVERGREALAVLRDNLETLAIDAEVVSADVLHWQPAATFDIVFCDPPWPMESSTVADLLDRIAPHVVDDGLAVVTRRASDPIPEPDRWRISDERRKGDTRIVRYRKEPT